MFCWGPSPSTYVSCTYVYTQTPQKRAHIHCDWEVGGRVVYTAWGWAPGSGSGSALLTCSFQQKLGKHSALGNGQNWEFTGKFSFSSYLGTPVHRGTIPIRNWNQLSHWPQVPKAPESMWTSDSRF